MGAPVATVHSRKNINPAKNGGEKIELQSPLEVYCSFSLWYNPKEWERGILLLRFYAECREALQNEEICLVLFRDPLGSRAHILQPTWRARGT